MKLADRKGYTMRLRAPVLDYQFVPAQGGTAPVFLLLPGAAGRESELLAFGCNLLPDSVTLLVESSALTHGLSRQPFGLTGRRFTHELIIQRVRELADTVQCAAEHYHLGRRHLIAVGVQEGAALAAGLLLLRDKALAAAVLLRPMLPLVPEQSPSLRGKAVLIVACHDDPLIPAAETEQLITILREAGAEVTLCWQSAKEARRLQVRPVRIWLNEKGVT
jgi:phospholipase/carboxylesterase